MISYSESFKIKWNYEHWSWENEKGEDVPYLSLRQNYNINRKNSKRKRSLVKKKKIPAKKNHKTIMTNIRIQQKSSYHTVVVFIFKVSS